MITFIPTVLLVLVLEEINREPADDGAGSDVAFLVRIPALAVARPQPATERCPRETGAEPLCAGVEVLLQLLFDLGLDAAVAVVVVAGSWA